MMTKTAYYMQMAQEAAAQITGSDAIIKVDTER